MSPDNLLPRRVWKEFRRLPPVIMICVILVVVIVAMAVAAPRIAPFDPSSQKLLQRLRAPAPLGGPSEHLLGTDNLGRDVLSRIIWGLRLSLLIGALGTLIGLVVGVTLGVIAGFLGGRVESAIMFLVDAQLALPFTLIALTVIALFGMHLSLLILVIGLSGWSQYARVARAEVLAVRERDFVEAAEALGASQWRIAMRHILPNITSPLIVLSTYNFSQIMLLESALSFLGLGVQPPRVSLGSLVGAGRDYLMSAWWIAIAPAAMLVVVTMVIALLGDYLRDRLDPRLQQ